MSLAAGSRLGPYEIVAPLGAGGMGEVYRARDTRLDRDVAIKVLPAAVAADPDRRSRFEREAKAVAALSHPNILAIHDFGVDGHTAFAVMELLRGQTLRERLNGGALPVRKSTEIAIQIARGLAAAHDKGLVHRDLKPENLFVLDDGQVKILDFGLAKSDLPSPSSAADLETRVVTDPGTVMGTVGYMAPEQVRGHATDARADLFALGAVLYEMLSGQRAFRRDTAAETMTAILKDDPPDLIEGRADLPASLDRIVHHCLEKNPAERFQTARDIVFALETLSNSGTARSSSANAVVMKPTRRVPVAFGGGLLITAVAAALAGWWLHDAPSPTRKFDLAIESLDTDVSRPPVLSPDGRRVVYSASDKLWVRALDSLDAVEIPDTTNALFPSWSPDSRMVTYTKGSQLLRASLDGAKAVTLGTVPVDMSGSGSTCWLADGRVLLAGSNTIGISAISDRGGDLTTVLALDKNSEADFHEMSPIPGGVLFTVHHVASRQADTIEAFVNGTRKIVLRLPGESVRRPIYLSTGHLLYHRETINPGLWAVKFSAKTLTTDGAPFLVEPGGSWPSLSSDGTLMFVRPSGVNPDLVWVDRSGGVATIVALPQQPTSSGGNRFLSLSRDGRHLLMTMTAASSAELWTYDLTSRSFRKITNGAGQAVSPHWMPDGNYALVAAAFSGRNWNVYRININGGQADRLTTSDQFQYSISVSPDGRTVVFGDATSGGAIWTVALAAAGNPSAPVRVGDPSVMVDSPALSADGRLLAYVGAQGSQFEIMVREFPSGTELRQVSTGGGTSPTWSVNGSELVYRSGDKVMAAQVGLGPTGITASQSKELATVPARDGFSSTFEVAADGRLLMTRTSGRDHIAIILNWPNELKRLEAAGAR